MSSAIKQLKQNTRNKLKELNMSCDEKILNNATAKARIWAKYAYGDQDYWHHYLSECGDFVPQYKECIETKNDQNSFNRLNARTARGRR